MRMQPGVTATETGIFHAHGRGATPDQPRARIGWVASYGASLREAEPRF